jgi:hypothetical protein
VQQEKHPPLKELLRLVYIFIFLKKNSHIYIRKRVLKRLKMKIIVGLRMRFLKKGLTSLNVQMEVTTHRLMSTPATNRKPLTLKPPKMRRVPRKVLRPSLVSV